MKDLLSKEHYYYKVHTSLMKSSTYPLSFYRQPLASIWIALYFYKKILIHPSKIFQQSQTATDKGDSHYGTAL